MEHIYSCKLETSGIVYPISLPQPEELDMARQSGFWNADQH